MCANQYYACYAGSNFWVCKFLGNHNWDDNIISVKRWNGVNKINTPMIFTLTEEELIEHVVLETI